jgi:ATP-binding cassette subfamily B protein
VDLSGGQWQSLGLARCVMRPDPLLMLLDEPAAAMDAAAEHAMVERFCTAAAGERAGSGAITLFISHRFSTVRTADQIVVLDGGRVRESGRHRDLAGSSGLYAELYDLQARVYR